MALSTLGTPGTMNPLLAHTKKERERERKKETLALLEYSLLKPTRLTGNL